MKGKRHDRVMANIPWLSMFPNHYVNVLPRAISDHHPLLKGLRIPRRDHRPFRYLHEWALDCRYKELLHTSCRILNWIFLLPLNKPKRRASTLLNMSLDMLRIASKVLKPDSWGFKLNSKFIPPTLCLN